MKLLIADTPVLVDDGPHSFRVSTTSVDFEGAGLYRFFVQHFENGGDIGVTVLANGSPLPTSMLYAQLGTASSPVPEPMSAALLGAGLLGLGVVGRRRALR